MNIKFIDRQNNEILSNIVASSAENRENSRFLRLGSSCNTGLTSRLLSLKCSSPLYINGVLISCGYCPECLNRKKIEWSWRLNSERVSPTCIDCQFTHLTYSNEFLPVVDSVKYRKYLRVLHTERKLMAGSAPLDLNSNEKFEFEKYIDNSLSKCKELRSSPVVTRWNKPNGFDIAKHKRFYPVLVKSDLQKYLHSIKDTMSYYGKKHGFKLAVRYYAIGEYGGLYLRPHYHVYSMLHLLSVNGSAIDEKWFDNNKNIVDGLRKKFRSVLVDSWKYCEVIYKLNYKTGIDEPKCKYTETIDCDNRALYVGKYINKIELGKFSKGSNIVPEFSIISRDNIKVGLGVLGWHGIERNILDYFTQIDNVISMYRFRLVKNSAFDILRYRDYINEYKNSFEREMSLEAKAFVSACKSLPLVNFTISLNKSSYPLPKTLVSYVLRTYDNFTQSDLSIVKRYLLEQSKEPTKQLESFNHPRTSLKKLPSVNLGLFGVKSKNKVTRALFRETSTLPVTEQLKNFADLFVASASFLLPLVRVVQVMENPNNDIQLGYFDTLKNDILLCGSAPYDCNLTESNFKSIVSGFASRLITKIGEHKAFLDKSINAKLKHDNEHNYK